MIKNFLNPEGHENPISGSKVTTILLKGGILPIGGASSGEGLRLQPAQQACLNGNGNTPAAETATYDTVKENLSSNQTLQSCILGSFLF